MHDTGIMRSAQSQCSLTDHVQDSTSRWSSSPAKHSVSSLGPGRARHIGAHRGSRLARRTCLAFRPPGASPKWVMTKGCRRQVTIHFVKLPSVEFFCAQLCAPAFKGSPLSLSKDIRFERRGAGQKPDIKEIFHAAIACRAERSPQASLPLQRAWDKHATVALAGLEEFGMGPLQLCGWGRSRVAKE